MKAAVIERYGSRKELKIKDVPRPVPGEHEILIRNMATSVNPLDWKVRKGMLKERRPLSFPLILGWDVSGVVEAVGSKVTSFQPGDELFAMPDLTRNGSYAEYVTVHESHAAHKPKNIRHLKAATLPLTGLTAWQSLIDAARLEKGERVLIHAGAGGVGSFAVQLAKHIGAYVYATASSRNHHFLKQIGADEVIDYTSEDFVQRTHELDVVFDTVGGGVYRKSAQVLKKGGRLVSILEKDAASLKGTGDFDASHVSVAPSGRQLEKIARLVEEERIVPAVERVYDLEEIRDAHAESESGHVRGKIAIRIA